MNKIVYKFSTQNHLYCHRSQNLKLFEFWQLFTNTDIPKNKSVLFAHTHTHTHTHTHPHTHTPHTHIYIYIYIYIYILVAPTLVHIQPDYILWCIIRTHTLPVGGERQASLAYKIYHLTPDLKFTLIKCSAQICLRVSSRMPVIS